MTAATLGAMNIPRGVHRLLFRTDNTARGLMRQLAFDSSYAAFTLGGVCDSQLATGLIPLEPFLFGGKLVDSHDVAYCILGSM